MGDPTAVATLVLAGVTVVLVLATFRLGARAAEEMRAQWRPILILRSALSIQDAPNRRLRIEVENVGRGPAIGVRASARFPEGRVDSASQVSVLPVGERAEFDIELVRAVNAQPGHVAYTDISRAGYGSAFVADMTAVLPTGPTAELPLVHQSFHMHGPVTFWWAKVTPPPLRRYVWRLTWRVLRWRGYDAP